MIFDFGKINIRDEFVAALTVFLASAYVLFLNPQILSDAGMDFSGAFFATCITASLGTLLLALIANKPYIIGPGITVSIFFTYTLVQTQKISWEIALAASLVVGIVLLVLSLSKIRFWFVEAIPSSLRYGILGGIGLMLMFVGFKNAHLVVPTSSTFVTLGSITEQSTLLALFGLIITSILFIRGVKGAFLLGIFFTTLLSLLILFLDGSSLPELKFFDWPQHLSAVALKVDIAGLMNSNLLSTVFAFFLIVFFDTIGTATALLIKGRHVGKKGNIKDLDKVMLSDSIATIFGALLGTSAHSVYAESASSYPAGGRTGLVAIFISLFFVLSLFFFPLVKLVPLEATAPVLIIVGLLFVGGIKNIDVRNYSESIPAFFCFAAIPLTFSISHGIGLAAILYVLFKIFCGKMSKVHPGLYITALLFLLDFLEVF